MAQFSITVPDEILDLISKCCELSGRSRNSACAQWLMEGTLRELKMFEDARMLKPDNSDQKDSRSSESVQPGNGLSK